MDHAASATRTNSLKTFQLGWSSLLPIRVPDVMTGFAHVDLLRKRVLQAA